VHLVHNMSELDHLDLIQAMNIHILQSGLQLGYGPSTFQTYIFSIVMIFILMLDQLLE